MIRFRGGPAEGQFLMLRRAPLYLRVTRDTTAPVTVRARVRSTSGRREAWDALDQLDDTPKPSEEIHVYRRVGEAGWAMVDWTEGGRRRGGCFASAEYEYVTEQPKGGS